MKEYIHELQSVVSADMVESLRNLSSRFANGVIFSTSFSVEDQVISHIILTNNLPISIFTLDTGRLFPETYTVWHKTNERYNTTVQAYFPNTAHVEKYVTEKGPNAFYNSVENRKACCFIRKVEPLKRALSNQSVWVTGLRAEHSATRQHLSTLEWDESNSIIKYNPLLHWPTDAVADFIKANNIPYNPLHEKGFVSIGCSPCTRAILPGEDMRAGRWWWEDTTKKECGLHER